MLLLLALFFVSCSSTKPQIPSYIEVKLYSKYYDEVKIIVKGQPYKYCEGETGSYGDSCNSSSGGKLFKYGTAQQAALYIKDLAIESCGGMDVIDVGMETTSEYRGTSSVSCITFRGFTNCSGGNAMFSSGTIVVFKCNNQLSSI